MMGFSSFARCCALLGLSACSSRDAAQEVDRPEPPQATLYGARMERYEGTQLAVSGRAAKVTYHRTSSDVFATEAFLRLPAGANGVRSPEQGKAIGLEVRTPSLQGNLLTRRAEAFDDVRLKTSSGLQGRTRRLIYDAREDTAYGKEGVTLTGPGYRLSAKTFFLDLAEEHFSFDGAVDSRLGALP